MIDVYDLLRLSSVPKIGPHKIRALLAQFHTPAAVLAASPRELIKVPGIDKKLASNIAHHEGADTYADFQLKKVNKAGGRLLTMWDGEFPDLLKKIYDPPVLLYVTGKLVDTDRYALAVVGTRLPSRYGEQMAELISVECAKIGITVVSGLARGIDTVAHTATLHSGSRTLAVIGSGLDVPYPPENRKLLEAIADSGAVVTEFPMGTKPEASNFPRRNRIISGLSLGTVVVESAEDGGAMITASTALDQNREVFAVPGNLTEKRSRGPNKLIQEGRAKLVLSMDDILDELRPQLHPLLGRKEPPPPVVEVSLFERKILDALDASPLHVDAIAETAGLSASDTLVTLLSLEFKRLVRQLPGKMFVRF